MLSGGGRYLKIVRQYRWTLGAQPSAVLLELALVSPLVGGDWASGPGLGVSVLRLSSRGYRVVERDAREAMVAKPLRVPSEEPVRAVMNATVAHNIGILRETSLHAALKAWYACPGDEFEVSVDGFQVDLRRGAQLVEFQTRNFAALKPKLAVLVERHSVRLVHPIAQEKWIVRLEREGATPASRRKSPRRGRVEMLFRELVSFPELVASPRFSLEVLMTQEEEILRLAGRGSGRRASWRRKGWEICDRRLLNVVERVVFACPSDFRRFLPDSLPQPFTSRELALATGQSVDLAQKITYCMRKMGAIEGGGKRGGALLYTS